MESQSSPSVISPSLSSQSTLSGPSLPSPHGSSVSSSSSPSQQDGPAVGVRPATAWDPLRSRDWDSVR